ncbi:MAG: histidine phosphatase family protein [bacterium]|nr:histidine phosphatase family protein [bacterium]
MNVLYLIRHGEKQRGQGDPGLSELGLEQAKKTALYLSSFPINAIYSSPSARTRETAQIIAETLRLKVIFDDLLKERMYWDQPDQSFEEFLKEWESASSNPDFVPRSGNSVRQTAERLNQFICERRSDGKDKQIVAVTHGGTIRDFLTLLSEEHKAMFTHRNMEGIHECSITELSFDSSSIKITSFDEIIHLLVK